MMMMKISMNKAIIWHLIFYIYVSEWIKFKTLENVGKHKFETEFLFSMD